MLEQLDDEQVEDVVQLVEITNNVQTAPASPPPTAAPPEPQVASTPVNEVAVEVEPLSDSGDGVDALTAPTAVNADADSDAAGEPVVTATIPAALVAEGTEVSLSLQDSFQVQEAPSTEVAAASDPTSGFASTSPETAGDAGGSTESPSTNLSIAAASGSSRMRQNRRLMTRLPLRRIRGRQRKPRARPTPMLTAMTARRMSRWRKQTRKPLATTTADAEAAAEDSAPATTDSATEQAPLVIAVTTVDSTQAQQTVATADAQATDRTVEELGLPDLGGRQTPSPAAIGAALTNIRQQVINAVRAGGNQP